MASVSARLDRSSPASGTRRDDADLRTTYSTSERLARDHYENFPVASWLLPRSMRPHVAAVYGFARVADDLADEGERSPGERRRLLDDWEARLLACVAGRTDDSRPDAPMFRALGHTIATCKLPVSLFQDLVSAFRQDTTTARYATWADLLDYCRRSANPVGRLVLRIAGHDDAGLDEASDAVCTALQLTNFWQDLERDWRIGRLYLPADIRERHGAGEEHLAARRLSPEWRAALSDAAARTRALFDAGRPVCDAVRGRLRLELRLTWIGGTTILDRLAAVHYDVFAARPTLGRRDALPLLARALIWRA